jgi:hypothetical protein
MGDNPRVEEPYDQSPRHTTRHDSFSPATVRRRTRTARWDGTGGAGGFARPWRGAGDR